jgi:aspartate carbamoyltransferase catalytic subunit
MLTQWVDASVVNAGDGMHQHPSQALLDLFTLRTRIGNIEGLKIWIIGDVLHSRVARSNIEAFQMMGAEVTVAGPPTLIPREIEKLGCKVEFSLERVEEADVVYLLRMQSERMEGNFIPSVREYARLFQINEQRLGPRQLVMHPGPVNRGVEIASEIVDSDRSLISDQVESGLAVRMAILYELLAGRPVEGGEGPSDPLPTIGAPA